MGCSHVVIRNWVKEWKLLYLYKYEAPLLLILPLKNLSDLERLLMWQQHHNHVRRAMSARCGGSFGWLATLWKAKLVVCLAQQIPAKRDPGKSRKQEKERCDWVVLGTDIIYREFASVSPQDIQAQQSLVACTQADLTQPQRPWNNKISAWLALFKFCRFLFCTSGPILASLS